MKKGDGIKVFSLTIEKILKKHGKCFLKMCGSPATSFNVVSTRTLNVLV